MTTREFVVEARVPPDVLAVWLTAHVGPRRGFYASTGSLYRGKVSHQGFSLQRNVNRERRFQPSVTGEFRPHSEGTTAHIVVRASGMGIAAGVVALTLGLGMSLLALLGLVPLAVDEAGEEPDLVWLVLAGPLIALSMVTMAIVYLEAGARQAHRDLTQILLGGQPGPNQHWPAPGTRGGPP